MISSYFVKQEYILLFGNLTIKEFLRVSERYEELSGCVVFGSGIDRCLWIMQTPQK